MYTQYLNQKFNTLKTIIKTNPVTFIESPTGSGKTTFILSLLAKHYKDKKILFISVNRTNCHQIVDGIKSYNEKNKDDFKLVPYIPPQEYLNGSALDYAEASTAYQMAFYECLAKGELDKIALNVLSLHHLQRKEEGITKIRGFDIIIIDEISSLFENLVSASVNVDNSIFLSAFKTLSWLLKNTEKIVLLDGNINPKLPKVFSVLTRKPYIVIRNTYKPKKCAKFVLCNTITKTNVLNSTIPELNELVESIKAAIKGKKKCVVSSTSRRLIEFLHKQSLSWYIDYYKDKRDLFDPKLLESTLVKIVGNNEASKLMLKKNINSLLLLVYSPAVSTALDITNFEDSSVYHIITSSNVSSTTNYQMINRTRGVKLVTILVSTSKINFKYKKLDFNSVLSNKCYNFRMVISALKDYYENKGYDWNRLLESTSTNKLYAPDVVSKELLRIIHYQYLSHKLDFERGILPNLKSLLDNESYKYKKTRDYRAISSNEDYIGYLLKDVAVTLEIPSTYTGRLYAIAGSYVYNKYKHKKLELSDNKSKVEFYYKLCEDINPDLRRYLTVNKSKEPLKNKYAIVNKIDKILLLVNTLKANETNEDKD